MKLFNLTADEKVVVERLVDDALDRMDSLYPLPLNGVKAEQVSDYVEPRRLDSGQRRLIQVALVKPENLTAPQKRYLGELLEELAGLCLAKAKRVTGDSADQILDRVKLLVK